MFELDEIIAGSVAHRELWARVSTRPDGEGHRCTAWWRPPSGPASSAGLRTPLWPDGRRWASCSTPRPSCIGRTPRPAMDFERRPLASPGPGNIWIFSRVKSLLEVHPVAAHNNNPDHPAKRMIPPFGRESQNGTHIKPTCVFNTCDNHFLHFSFCPLKVGTPLSALTPAPVMTAMCLALEKSSRNSSMSVKQNQHAELRRGNKRGFSSTNII